MDKPKAKVYIDGANIFYTQKSLNWTEVILFSGDSDFHYLAKKLKDLGKRFSVFSTRKMISWELKLAADEYIFLEDLKKKISR